MQADNNSTETHSPSGISRRTVVAGVAWAVPAITVAGTLPAMAASGCITFSFTSESCKDPGKPYGYKLVLCVASTCTGTTFPLTVTGIKQNNGNFLTKVKQTPPGNNKPVEMVTFEGPGCLPVAAFGFGSPVELTIYYQPKVGLPGSFTLSAPPKDCPK